MTACGPPCGAPPVHRGSDALRHEANRSSAQVRRSFRMAPAPLPAVEVGTLSVGKLRPSRPVWVRRRGEEVIVAQVGAYGPVEVASHQVMTPGNPRVGDANFPPAPEGSVSCTARVRHVRRAR